MKNKIIWIVVLFFVMTVQTIFCQTKQNLNSKELKIEGEDCHCDRLYVAEGLVGPAQTVFVNGDIGVQGHLTIGSRTPTSLDPVYDISLYGAFKSVHGSGGIGLSLEDIRGFQAPYIMWKANTATYMHSIRQVGDVLHFARYEDYPEEERYLMSIGGEFGNVVIGRETSPKSEYKLDVEGKIRSCGLVQRPWWSCLHPNWPDAYEIEDLPYKPQLISTKLINIDVNKYKLKAKKLELPKERIDIVTEDLEKVFPDLVVTTPNEKLKSIDYGGLTVVLLQAIKELRYENDDLKKRIAEIEKKLR